MRGGSSAIDPDDGDQRAGRTRDACDLGTAGRGELGEGVRRCRVAPARLAGRDLSTFIEVQFELADGRKVRPRWSYPSVSRSEAVDCVG